MSEMRITDGLINLIPGGKRYVCDSCGKYVPKLIPTPGVMK